jgi:alpha-galactosidase
LKKEDPKISKKEAEAQVEKSIDEILKEKSNQYRKEVIESHGHYYRLMMKEVEDCLSNLKIRFPTYEGQGYELSGFVWFQGWNDMYNGFEDEYAQNMKNFIRDIRKDLGLPRLPFVIGIMGQNGFKEATGNMAIVKAAQASMNEVEEFRGNVRAIPTDVYWDKKADEAYPTWRDNFEEWKKIGSDRPYHYLGSTIFFSRVGRAFGGDMLKLLTNK